MKKIFKRCYKKHASNPRYQAYYSDDCKQSWSSLFIFQKSNSLINIYYKKNHGQYQNADNHINNRICYDSERLNSLIKLLPKNRIYIFNKKISKKINKNQSSYHQKSAERSINNVYNSHNFKKHPIFCRFFNSQIARCIWSLCSFFCYFEIYHLKNIINKQYIYTKNNNKNKKIKNKM